MVSGIHADVLKGYIEAKLGTMVARQVAKILDGDAGPDELNDTALEKVKKLLNDVIRDAGDGDQLTDTARDMIEDIAFVASPMP